MSRWALYAAVTLSVAGCTRLNGAFADEQGDTDGPMRGSDSSPTSGGVTGDPPLSTTAGSNSTTDASSTTDPTLPTEGPTEPETHTGTGTGDGECLSVSEEDSVCDVVFPESCAIGECRPYGSDEEFTGIGCVQQPSTIRPLDLGERCTQECGGLLGTNACPSGSTCDPFGEESTCLPFCDQEEDVPCGEGSSCFTYLAGAETFGLCRPGCNPLNADPSDCPIGQSCLPIGTEAFSCVEATDAGGPGEQCDSVEDCGGGLFCANPAELPACKETACCTPFCSVGLNDCQAPGLVCTELAVGVGICLLPED